MIASKLDTEMVAATCRLAFYGRIMRLINTGDPAQLSQLRVFKYKEKCGSVDRIAKDKLSAVCKGMFKKETDISPFIGMKVRT